MRAFKSALAAAGFRDSSDIGNMKFYTSATYRPPERAISMYAAGKIADGDLLASKVGRTGDVMQLCCATAVHAFVC